MIGSIISTGFEKYFLCKNKSEMPYLKIKLLLQETIWNAYRNGYTDFYVNCEYGIPLWAAEIISALKFYNVIRLHIIVPYEEQTTNWTEEQRDRYYTSHQKADSIQFANTKYHEYCYEQADKMMIDHSDLVFVFGKDQPSNAELYATQTGIPVQRIIISK